MPDIDEIIGLFRTTKERGEPLLVLTGAGISAESGIRTFRGPGGYWNEDSELYRPEEMATWSFFQSEPEISWTWYLKRRNECQRAQPNEAHRALVGLSQYLDGQVDLVTQNVDGLHRRSGFPNGRLMEIHGNLDFVRCSEACSQPIWAVPAEFNDLQAEFQVDGAVMKALACPGCGGLGRPHVLWFDECYNETHFKLISAQAAARRAALLLVVGTTGTTNLPHRLGQIAAERKIPLIDINIEDNVFRSHAESSPGSFAIKGEASSILAAIVRALPTED